MSQQDVEFIRSIQPPAEADVARDVFLRDADPETVAAAVAAFEELVTEDFVCVFHRASDGPRAGVSGWRDAWLDWLEPWEAYRSEITEVIGLDDTRVLVTARDYGRRKGMSGEVEMQGSAVYTMRDGKIVRAEYFAQRDEALAAAGAVPSSGH